MILKFRLRDVDQARLTGGTQATHRLYSGKHNDEDDYSSHKVVNPDDVISLDDDDFGKY